jgi:hypothetical protein
MPRFRSPARLLLRPARRHHRANYVIRDGKLELSTGTGNRLGAERALAAYLIHKHKLLQPEGPTSTPCTSGNGHDAHRSDDTALWLLRNLR